jgi:hypothetical protein
MSLPRTSMRWLTAAVLAWGLVTGFLVALAVHAGPAGAVGVAGDTGKRGEPGPQGPAGRPGLEGPSRKKLAQAYLADAKKINDVIDADRHIYKNSKSSLLSLKKADKRYKNALWQLNTDLRRDFAGVNYEQGQLWSQLRDAVDSLIAENLQRVEQLDKQIAASSMAEYDEAYSSYYESGEPANKVRSLLGLPART